MLVSYLHDPPNLKDIFFYPNTYQEGPEIRQWDLAEEGGQQ